MYLQVLNHKFDRANEGHDGDEEGEKADSLQPPPLLQPPSYALARHVALYWEVNLQANLTNYSFYNVLAVSCKEGNAAADL